MRHGKKRGEEKEEKHLTCQGHEVLGLGQHPRSSLVIAFNHLHIVHPGFDRGLDDLAANDK